VHPWGGWAVGLAAALTAGSAALAQESPVTAGTPLPGYARHAPAPARGDGPVFIATTNGLPNVLLTGYWPPTNEMLRQFSRNLDQNSNGWVGENWEGRGYNVYAYFPEFPDGFGKGVGDFEVDYQDTSNDWWLLVPAMDPIAIITFSRASSTVYWEPEGGNRTYALAAWSNDYVEPFDPTPELPIAAETPLTVRYSTLPIAAIMHNVSTSGAAVVPIASYHDLGAYLSDFIGYHGVWYHDLHADPADPDWVACAGHVHVGYAMDLASAVLATEVTVRTVLGHVDTLRALAQQGDLDGNGTINLLDYSLWSGCMSGPGGGLPGACGSAGRFDLADLDGDGGVDLRDFGLFAAALVAQAPPALALPFFDAFDTTTFDPARWELIASAEIDDVGLAEPSAPYAARLNRSTTGADAITSRPIDARSPTPVHLAYAWQRTGGGNSTETGDDLLVEFQDVVGGWHELARHLGSEADMTTFAVNDLVLPAAALHHQFRVRFREAVTSGTSGDDWFVDDVSLTAE